MSLLSCALAVSLAAPPPVNITLAPESPPVLGDGTTSVVLIVRVEAKRKLSPRLVVRPTRGKVLKVTPLVNGSAEVRYLPPAVKHEQKVGFVVLTQVGSRRVKVKLQLVVRPPQDGAPPAAPAAGEVAGALPPVAPPAAPAAGEVAGALPLVAPPKPMPAGPPGTASAADPLAGAPPLPTAYRGVAVLPLQAIDTTPEVLHWLEETLCAEVDEAKGLRAVSPLDVQSEVAPAGLATNCEDVECVALAGRFARAHLAISGRVAATGGVLSTSLQLVDTQQRRELQRVTGVLPDDGQERALALHRLAVELLDPDAYVGALRLECTQPEAEIFLDEKFVGTTPLAAPLTRLRAGTHILQISKAGFSTLHRFIDIGHNHTSTVQLDLESQEIKVALIAESESGFGTLRLHALEPGLEVRIDGEPLGTTPLKAPLTGVRAGKRRLTLRKEGFETVSMELTIERDQQLEMTAEVSSGRILARPGAPAPTRASEAEVFASMSPRPASGWTWQSLAGTTGGAVAAASLAAAGYYGWRIEQGRATSRSIVVDSRAENLSYGSYEKLAQEAQELNASTARMVRLQRLALGAGIGLGLSAAGLLAWHFACCGGNAPAVAVSPQQGGIAVLGTTRF